MAMSEKTNSAIVEFIAGNAKAIMTCVIFLGGLYLQYQANMIKLNQMEKELNEVRAQVNDQYVKLDNMKLDKTVFEATMRQFTDMSADIRQIRERMEDILGDHVRHNPNLAK